MHEIRGEHGGSGYSPHLHAPHDVRFTTPDMMMMMAACECGDTLTAGVNITMGRVGRTRNTPRHGRDADTFGVKISAFLQLSGLENKRNRSSAVDLLG